MGQWMAAIHAHAVKLRWWQCSCEQPAHLHKELCLSIFACLYVRLPLRLRAVKLTLQLCVLAIHLRHCSLLQASTMSTAMQQREALAFVPALWHARNYTDSYAARQPPAVSMVAVCMHCLPSGLCRTCTGATACRTAWWLCLAMAQVCTSRQSAARRHIQRSTPAAQAHAQLGIQTKHSCCWCPFPYGLLSVYHLGSAERTLLITSMTLLPAALPVPCACLHGVAVWLNVILKPACRVGVIQRLPCMQQPVLGRQHMALGCTDTWKPASSAAVIIDCCRWPGPACCMPCAHPPDASSAAHP